MPAHGGTGAGLRGVRAAISLLCRLSRGFPEPGYGGEIQLTDALSKLDEIYGQVFTGESYDIGNRIDWLKSSLKIALEDEEARDILLKFIHEEII